MEGAIAEQVRKLEKDVYNDTLGKGRFGSRVCQTLLIHRGILHI
jgi:hypothetical protein